MKQKNHRSLTQRVVGMAGDGWGARLPLTTEDSRSTLGRRDGNDWGQSFFDGGSLRILARLLRSAWLYCAKVIAVPRLPAFGGCGSTMPAEHFAAMCPENRQALLGANKK